MIPSLDISSDPEWTKKWIELGMMVEDKDTITPYIPYDTGGPRCDCGASKVYAREPNLEYLHAPYCQLYLDPNWMNKLKAEYSKGE